ncbi:MAG: hypothetical protein ACRDD5_00940 [Silvania sp.]|uniref:hypothetical protein n=1 Tax=Silvania sp. TaxID=3016633 RepID=UPI003EE7664D
MAEFTREQLIDRINQVTAINKYRIRRDPDADGLVMDNEIFAIALAALTAGVGQEPVGYYRLAEDGVSYYLSSPDQQRDGTIPLYAAPQLPQPAVVPLAVSWEDVPEKITEDDMGLASAWAHGFNQCRTAMLQGKAEPVCQPYTLPEGYCAMPKRLTAENGAKGALSGEFHVTHRIACQSCGGEGCEDCNEEGGWDGEIPIGWDTIKLIYGAAVELCALPAAPQQEVK